MKTEDQLPSVKNVLTMKPIRTNTLIVGAGQAGLATSYYLKLLGYDHIVLDRAEKAADMWRNQTWDSFTFVTPNWSLRMPGADYAGENRNEFMARRMIIEFFEDYITRFNLPVKFDIDVKSVAQISDEGYLIKTNGPDFVARNVVIATGFFQSPKNPRFSHKISPNVRQLHSSQYRNPFSLPEGSVLVVGSGQSGGQIAQELFRAGRKVFLSVGRAGRVPRRYRGRDIIEWLELIGLFDLTPEQLPPGMGKFDGIPHLSGVGGGRTINLHEFARDGITLLGHVIDANQNIISLAPDLHATLEMVDSFESNATAAIDEYISTNGIDAPEVILPKHKHGFQQRLLENVDLRKERINTIIWCTGFNFDYSMVKLPVFDADGFPVQSKGVTNFPGLYFVGMPWMPSERSGVLFGIGEAARHIASQITEHSQVRHATT